MLNRFLSLFLVLFLASCAETAKPPADKITLTPVGFSDLNGWNDDHQLDAIPALAHSCTRKAKAPDWVKPCAALTATPPQNDRAARQFIETWFRPYAASGASGDEGLFTGYYESSLRGSWQKTGVYQTPLYARPNDLIGVDLGDFKADLKGQHIEGKVDGHKLKPYDDRAAIVKNSLSGRAQALLYVDDPVDAFFLAVQGSGRVTMNDGSVARVGYDGANGRAYVAIGRVLADRGELDKPVTMQGIRAWLTHHPDRADEIMNLNPSYVFFRKLNGENPVGAAGFALTPRRSLAVDPAFVALGTPLWLDTTDGHGASVQRLMVAEDTGGAIKGAVRGDFFWGFGAEAESEAGAMQSRGHYYLLLPKTATP